MNIFDTNDGKIITETMPESYIIVCEKCKLHHTFTKDPKTIKLPKCTWCGEQLGVNTK